MNAKQTIKRLTYLHDMIGKYAHRWNQSDRLAGWVVEYEQIRDGLVGWKSTREQYQVWKEFCDSVGAVTSHTAYDCLA